MTDTDQGEAVSRAYLVTLTETFRVEADSEDEAINVADELHELRLAVTTDVQVEALV